RRQRSLVHRAGHTCFSIPGIDLLRYLLLQAVVTDIQFALLINGGIQEEGQDHGRRPVNGKINGSGTMVGQVKPRIEYFGIVQGGYADAGAPYLSENIGTEVRIKPV